jgi:hypothetical protein
MKKIFFSALLVAFVISMTSCASHRKLGCPSTAKTTIKVKNANS